MLEVQFNSFHVISDVVERKLDGRKRYTTPPTSRPWPWFHLAKRINVIKQFFIAIRSECAEAQRRWKVVILFWNDRKSYSLGNCSLRKNLHGHFRKINKKCNSLLNRWHGSMVLRIVMANKFVTHVVSIRDRTILEAITVEVLLTSFRSSVVNLKCQLPPGRRQIIPNVNCL